MKAALDKGYRVTTNTTIFNGVDEDDMIEMFKMLTAMGVEGCMVSPGYQFDSVPNQELFISRRKAREVFNPHSGSQARDQVLQQSPVSGLPSGRPGVPVHRLVEPHLHGVPAGVSPATCSATATPSGSTS